VAIDPGHGGTADNTRPDRQFDPGVTAANGLLEKDLTLEVANRLKSRLEKDRVQVVMTRESDAFVSIAAREAAANGAPADLFVSIHFNYFSDPTVGGSLILYPNAKSQAFAGAMADNLDSKLKPFGIVSNGLMLKPDLWSHAAMPAVTVEAAYLTNPKEADLMTKGNTLDGIASSIDAGIRAQAPEIAQRKSDITAYEKAHAPQPALVAGAPRSPLIPAAVVALLVLAVVFRRRLAPVLVPVLAAVIAVVGYSLQRYRRQPEWRNRRGVRRRRHRARPWQSRVKVRAW
jgi:N-acetylmuramoyl-L-alanine amidase